MSILRAFVDEVFDLLVFKSDQFISSLDLRPVLDHPVNGAITSDVAFNFCIVGALQRPLLG